MKKLILLLLPLWSIAQTSTGQEQEFDYGIKNNSAQTVTSPTFLTTTGTDGTQGKSSNVVNQVNSSNNSGILSFDGLAVNVDPTKYDIGAGVGYVMNSLTGVSTKVTWASQTAQTTPYILTSVATYVLKDNAGATVLQNSAPTPQQYRTHIYLGKLAHTTFTTILFAVTEPSRMFDTTGQVSDVNKFLGSGNIEGNAITYNGANLNINASAGMTYRPGANYLNDRNSPSITTETSFTAGSFRNKFRNGSGGWSAVNTTTIDPNYYDDGTGILAVVPNNKWTIKVFWRFGGTGTIHCDYGQTVYDSKAQALEAVGKAVTAEDPETKRDASKRGWLVVKQGITVLNDITTAEFLQADKFGERAAGGSSTATMQTAYNNSVTPQITTSTGLGAVAFKRGSAADTDNVLVVQNGSGSDTFSVKGNGDTSVFGLLSGVNGNFSSSMQAASFNVPGGTSSQFLKADGSVDSNIYATNSSVVHLSGTETISGNKTFTGQNTFTSAASSTAITVTASTSGNGITVNNNSNGNGFTVNNNSTGVGEIINSATASTSDLTRWQKNGTTTSKVDHNGNITGVSFIKSGATAGNILLAGGTDIAQSTFATSASLSGYLPLIAGFSNSISGDLYVSNSNPQIFLNNSTATTGKNWKLNSFSNGGFYIGIPGLFDALELSNTGAATFASTVTATSGYSWGNGTYVGGISQLYNDATNGTILISKTGSSRDFVFHNGAGQGVIENPTGTQNLLFRGSGTFDSTVTASNGTLIGGTLTSGYIPKATGANSLGNSLIYDNGTNVGIGTASPANRLTVSANDIFNQDTSGQLVIRGVSNTNKALLIGFDTTSNYGYIQAMEQGSSARPFVFQPFSGNVLINTTTDDGVNKLQVNGSGKFTGNIELNGNSGGTSTYTFFKNNGTNLALQGSDASIFGGSAANFGIYVYGNNDLELSTNNTKRLIINGAGVTKITDLAGSGTRMVTADSSGNLAASTIVTSGTYAPTLTNTSNITSSSINQATYTRIGNVINVNVSVATTVTATATPSVLTLTLPINTADTTQTGVGVGNLTAGDSTVNAAGIVGVISASTAEFVFYPNGSGSGTSAISFQYNLN